MKNLSKPIKIIGICLYAAMPILGILLGAFGGLWLGAYVPFLIFAVMSVIGVSLIWNLEEYATVKICAAAFTVLLKIAVIVFFEILWFQLIYTPVMLSLSIVFLSKMAAVALFELAVLVRLSFGISDGFARPSISIPNKVLLGALYVVTLGCCAVFDYFAGLPALLTLIYAVITAMQSVLYHISKKTGKWNTAIVGMVSALKVTVIPIVLAVAIGVCGLVFDFFFTVMAVVTSVAPVAACVSELFALAPKGTASAPLSMTQERNA